jgi:hypothetical protein
MHLYVVMRVDDYLPSDRSCVCVSAWITRELAQAEVERLSEIRRGGSSRYEMVVTRLKEVETDQVYPATQVPHGSSVSIDVLRERRVELFQELNDIYSEMRKLGGS